MATVRKWEMLAATKVKMSGSENKVNSNTYNISSIRRVTRKFLEVSSSLFQYYNKALNLYDVARHQNLENNLSQVQHNEDSPVPTDVLLLAIWTSVLFSLDFSFYISVALVINFFYRFFY